MSMRTLTMLMGAEEDGLYEVSACLRNLGMNCGEPSRELLANPDRARSPDPGLLWYWNAIRRFYLDMGLSPIAEVPSDLINELERKYYIALFARSLMQSLKNGSFICADHLSALVLPLLVESLKILKNSGIDWRIYFFFTNPARSIYALLNKNEKPVKLGEFIWRNTATSAMRHAARQIILIDVDKLDEKSTQILFSEISEFYGCEKVLKKCESPFVSPLPSTSLTLSSLTWRLYHAMQNGSKTELEKAARAAWEAQSDQNGWQYLDCLEYRISGKNIIGEEKYHFANSLISNQADQSQTSDKTTPETSEALYAESYNDWLSLLGMVERSCLDTLNSQAARLFRYADLLGRDYRGIYENLSRMSAISKKDGLDE